MLITLHASFADAAMAEKAMGALMDHGADKLDVSGFFPEDYETPDVHEVQANVEHGITTTTPADAAAGAAKGAGIGLGVGAVAALASLVIPGFGIVAGGGALATALMAMAGTAAGGAISGGVAGFLQDQGIPEKVALDSEAALKNGRAVVVAKCPTGKMSEGDVTEILVKYGAETFGRVEYPVVVAQK
mgnify:CR=1 FL=1